MAKHSVQHVLLFGKETTYGTAVSPTKDLGLRQNFSIAAEQAAREIHTTGQAGAAQTAAGKADLKGSLELLMQHGRPLEYIFGTVAHAQSTNDWTHTFTVADDLPSMTLESSYEDSSSDVSHTLNGVKFTSATIGLALDGSLSFRADWMAKDTVNATTASSDVLSTLASLHDFHGAFKTGTEGGETAVAETQSFEITLNRNTKKIWGLGDRENTKAAGMQLNVDFTATVGFNDNTEFARLLGGTSIGATADTPFGVVMSADNGTALGSGKRALTMTLQNVHYRSVNITTPIGDWIMADVAGTGTVSATGCTYVDNISSGSW
jgi:hypothetical protein